MAKMRKSFSNGRFVIVFLIFIAFTITSFAITEDDITLNVFPEQSNANLSDNITLTVEIENDNLTTNMTNFELRARFNSSAINFTNSDINTTSQNEGEITWNVNVSNFTSEEMQIYLTVINNSYNNVTFELYNTSSHLMVEQIIYINSSIPIIENITNQTNQSNQSSGNQSNQSNSTQENITIQYYVINMTFEVEYENGTLAKHINASMWVNTTNVTRIYRASNATNHTLTFYNVNISNTSTGVIKSLGYTNENFTGDPIAYLRESHDFREFYFDYIIEDLEDNTYLDNYDLEFYENESDEDDDDKKDDTYLSDIMVNFLAPDFADVLNVDEDRIVDIREVRFDRENVGNPIIPNDIIDLALELNEEKGRVLLREKESGFNRDAQVDVRTTIYEVILDDNTRMLLSKIEKELEIEIAPDDNYLKIVEYIPQNVTTDASNIVGDFQILSADPVIAFDFNITNNNTDDTITLETEYLLPGNVFAANERIFTMIRAREEFEIFIAEIKSDLPDSQEVEDETYTDIEVDNEYVEERNLDYYASLKSNEPVQKEKGKFLPEGFWTWIGVGILIILALDSLNYLRNPQNRRKLKLVFDLRKR